MTVKPRRCSKRYLDGDCPPEVLAIFDHGPGERERYEVFYTGILEVDYATDLPDRPGWRERWMAFYCLDAACGGYHGEMQVHDVRAYRYRMKKKYVSWSSLPEQVRDAVRRDIEEEVFTAPTQTKVYC